MSSLNAIVVDDDQEFCEHFKKWLESIGDVAITICHSISKFEKAMKSCEFTFLFLDIKLGKLNRLGKLMELADKYSKESIKVVVSNYIGSAPTTHIAIEKDQIIKSRRVLYSELKNAIKANQGDVWNRVDKRTWIDRLTDREKQCPIEPGEHDRTLLEFEGYLVEVLEPMSMVRILRVNKVNDRVANEVFAEADDIVRVRNSTLIGANIFAENDQFRFRLREKADGSVYSKVTKLAIAPTENRGISSLISELEKIENYLS